MVYVVCVNDGAVMRAWKKDQGMAGSDLIEFLADTDADLTKALGLVLTGPGKPYGKHAGPNNALGFHTKRCKRSAMYVVDGVVKVRTLDNSTHGQSHLITSQPISTHLDSTQLATHLDPSRL